MTTDSDIKIPPHCSVPTRPDGNEPERSAYSGARFFSAPHGLQCLFEERADKKPCGEGADGWDGHAGPESERHDFDQAAVFKKTGFLKPRQNT